MRQLGTPVVVVMDNGSAQQMDVEGENVAAAASDGDTDLIGKVAARGKPLMTHQPPRR